MRFAFTILDHRASLSIEKYTAPPIDLSDLLPASLVPTGAVYDGQGRYVVPVDGGARVRWTRGANDWAVINPATQQWVADEDIGIALTTPFADTGEILAVPFLAKATPTPVELVSWPTATIASADSIALGLYDVFFIPGAETFTSTTGLFKVVSAEGAYMTAVTYILHFTSWLINYRAGFTVRVLSGTVNSGTYFYLSPAGEWVSSPLGKVYLCLAGVAGQPVTASLQRIA